MLFRSLEIEKKIIFFLLSLTCLFSQTIKEYSGEIIGLDMEVFQRDCPDGVDSCLYVCSNGIQNPCQPENIYSIAVDTLGGTENSLGSRFRIYFPWEYEGLNANKFRVTASWPALSPTAVFAWGDYAYFDVIGNAALPGTVQGSIWYGSDCQDSLGNIGSEDCIELVGRLCFAPGDTLDWPEYMDQSIANDVCNACWVSFPAWNSYDDYPYSDSLLSPGNCDAFDHCHIDPPDSINCGIGFLDGEDTSLVKIDDHLLPVKYDFLRVAPNPFNPVTAIEYTVMQKCNVVINIFSIKGDLVDSFKINQAPVGSHVVNWNAGTMPSGVYFVHAMIGLDASIKKITLIK